MKKLFSMLLIATMLCTISIGAHAQISDPASSLSINEHFKQVYLAADATPSNIENDTSAYAFLKCNPTVYHLDENAYLTLQQDGLTDLTSNELALLQNFVERLNFLVEHQAITVDSNLLIQMNSNPIASPSDFLTNPRNTSISIMSATRSHANELWQIFFNALQFGDFSAQGIAGQYFADRVRTGGIWDYKRQLGTYTSYYVEDLYTTMTGEDIGNFHYGYVGSAAFGAPVLKSMAGMYQIYSGTSSIRYWDSFFDDPSDQAFIQMGINKYVAEH